MKNMILPFSMILLMTIFLVSCNKNNANKENEKKQVISVKVEIVKPQNVQISSSYTGSLEGEKQAVIYAKIAEAVEKINIHEGREVKAGDVIMTLNKTGPSSRYQQAKALYENAQKIYKKMEYLYQEGAVSETRYDAAKTEYEVDKASFDAAQQLVEIKSPINGMVTSVDVSVGNFIHLGQNLATVASTSKLRVKFYVNASEISFFQKGAHIYITSDEFPQEAQGEIITIASSADPLTRTFEIEALIDNSEGFFKPGMFVKVLYIQKELKNVITVPQKSVLIFN
ncbi:MAG: efflux RND transporter periplasmic adaptor subunit, partial [FCB group bacterium]|nr:efflux RND transporter periplasmic adaptor subunit [FCB group bacterium]